MNGSGREVLLSVIAGLYEQYDGLLAFDDIPYRSYDPIFLRGYVGDCLSQKTLFRGTLEENLTVGKTYIQRDQVQEALKQVDLLEWSQDLQMGLNTELTPEDQRFPPEIVRRLILARCLLKEPRLLMIEGFHRMGDKGTRQKIAEYVTAQPWTLIALSNDPNLASLCDRVVVLNGGQIQVQGTFEDISNMPFASQLFDSPC
jgi:ABC-type multidrug transport system fused ATPase/permease subunit